MEGHRMTIRSEVVVIGGGLAGSIAALTAAMTDAEVRLVTAAQSTLAQASGMIDVLGHTYVDGDLAEDRLVHPYAGLAGLPASHPYRILGEPAIRSGLETFAAAVGDAYCGGHTDRNGLLATPVGTVKPTARYPRSMAPGLLGRPDDTLLVGFEGIPGVDAPAVADRLSAAGVPFAVDGVTLSFPGEFPADAATRRYATALERDDAVSVQDSGATTTRHVLADRIQPHVTRHERVGFPAVLGEDDAAAVRRDLAGRLGVSVFELPGLPPSLPGSRLADRLETALATAGVRVVTGNPVVDYEAANHRVQRVVVDREGQRVGIDARAVVLATGGLVGRGIDSDRDGVREPVFNCHVPHPSDRQAWYRDDPFDDHPFARFGVRIDERARPVDGADTPEFENLMAAGGVVGGADVAREQSASGVSLATGAVAGREAAREVT